MVVFARGSPERDTHVATSQVARARPARRRRPQRLRLQQELLERGGAGTVDLVAYSTPKPAYDQLIKAFNATPAGKGVGFTSSYGASGDQARSVLSGLDAGYVAFASRPTWTSS